MQQAINSLLLIFFIVAVVTLLLRASISKGTAGENRVRSVLESLARSGEDFYPFHNLVLKTPDGTTQIDHVLVSPYGIFVIETKNFAGWIFGESRSRVWTQTIYRKKFTFQNPLRQNYQHVKAVQNFLGLNDRFVHSLVVFVGRGEFKTIVPNNVVYLSGLIAYVNSHVKRILNEAAISGAVKRLQNPPRYSTSSEEVHFRNIERNRNWPVCSRCGKRMVLRTAQKGRNTGNQFWGCTGFPKCKGIKNVA